MYKTLHQNQIVEFFKEHPDDVFTASDLIEKFQEQMNKATIYRKLHLLEENKMVRKCYNLSKQSYEYQLAQDCENHLHLVCKCCGKIIHLKCEKTNGFLAHLATDHGFMIDQESTMIFGICEGCRNHA